jgi:hypothetical protein
VLGSRLRDGQLLRWLAAILVIAMIGGVLVSTLVIVFG